MNITTTDNTNISIPVENIKKIINENYIVNSQQSYRVPFTFEEICNFVSDSASSKSEWSANFKKILLYLKSLFTPPTSEVISVDILGEQIIESQTYKFCEDIYSSTYIPLFQHNYYLLTNVEDFPGIYTQTNFVSRKGKQRFAENFDMKIVLREILDLVYPELAASNPRSGYDRTHNPPRGLLERSERESGRSRELGGEAIGRGRGQTPNLRLGDYNIVLYGQGVEYLHSTEYYLPLYSVKFYVLPRDSHQGDCEFSGEIVQRYIYKYFKNLKRFRHCNTHIYDISFVKNTDKICIVLYLSYSYILGHSINVRKTTLHLQFDLKSYTGIDDLFKNMIDSECIAWNGSKFYMNNRFVQSQKTKSVILRNTVCSENDILELRQCIDFGYTVLIPKLDIAKFLNNVKNPKFLLGFEEIAYNIMFSSSKHFP